MSLNAKISFKKPPFKKGKPFYYLIAGNVVVLAVLGVFVLRPVFSLVAKHASEITQERADIAALEEKTVQLQELKRTLPQQEALYEPVIENAPKTKDIAGYQTELADLAELTGVELLTVDTSGTSEDGQAKTTNLTVGGFPAFPVSMDVSGTYASILDFVNRLETMDRFTRVDSLLIDQADAAGELRATITAESLYFGKAS